MAIGESFAKHETVKHSGGEYVRDAVHVNSVEGFNSRVRRTIAAVFHHISPQHADLYFHEIGFHWSQRVVTGNVIRKTRHDRESVRTLWSRVLPALQFAERLSRSDRTSDATKPKWRHHHQISHSCLWLIKAAYDFEQLLF
jgi:hypothetical protein